MSAHNLLSTTYDSFTNILAVTRFGIFNTLASEAGTFLIFLMTVTLAMYLFQMVKHGVVDVHGLLYFGFRGALIYGLVTGGVLWADVALPFLDNLPENIGLFIYNSTRASIDPNAAAPNFVQILGIYIDSITNIGNKLSGRIDGDIFSFDEFTGAIAYFIMLVFAFLMVGVAFALLLVTEVFLFIFLALAPLFLVWSFLGATKNIFESYLGGIIKVMMVQIFVFALLGFFVAASDQVLENANFQADGLPTSGVENNFLLSRMWELTFLSIIGLVTMLAVPFMATAISGGAASFGATTTEIFKNALNSGGRGARRAAGSTARGTAALINKIRGGGAGGAVGSAGAARSSAKERAANLVRQTGRS